MNIDWSALITSVFIVMMVCCVGAIAWVWFGG
jgi:hypothetical protein